MIIIGGVKMKIIKDEAAQTWQNFYCCSAES